MVFDPMASGAEGFGGRGRFGLPGPSALVEGRTTLVARC
jgi:hypothetical protein